LNLLCFLDFFNDVISWESSLLISIDLSIWLRIFWKTIKMNQHTSPQKQSNNDPILLKLINIPFNRRSLKLKFSDFLYIISKIKWKDNNKIIRKNQIIKQKNPKIICKSHQKYQKIQQHSINFWGSNIILISHSKVQFLYDMQVLFLRSLERFHVKFIVWLK